MIGRRIDFLSSFLFVLLVRNIMTVRTCNVPVIFRDLKPENILIADDGHIKVTDFGTAKVLPTSSIELPPRPSKNSGRGRGPSNASGRPSVGRKSFVGTADYVSPEVLTDKTAGPPSDIWALGVILYQMLVGKTPFVGKSEYLVFQSILAREIIFPEDFDPLAKDLVEKLLVLEPSERLGAGEKGISELKAHPFFDGIDFKTLPKTPVPDIPPPDTQEDKLDGDELPSGKTNNPRFSFKTCLKILLKASCLRHGTY